MIESEKPRERLIMYGKENLSNEELISIILKTGTYNASVKTIASLILKKFVKIDNLKNATINKLSEISGIGKVKAIELLAAIELGRRVYYKSEKTRIKLNTTSKVFEYFKDIFYNEKQENFYAVYLDTKSNLISFKLLFIGTINISVVHPREIFKYAFLESACSIIVMHNHPSGDVLPSNIDIELTNHLFEIGQIMGIKVVDHIIFSKDKYYSFYNNMNNIK